MSQLNIDEPKGGQKTQARDVAVKAPEAETKPANFIPAAESRFETSAEYRSPLTSYVPEAGTPFEHLLRPEYWANIKQLRAGVRIWVMAEDEAYCGELLVRKVGQGFAHVIILRQIELSGIAALDPKVADGYDIQYRGVIQKHRIVRVKDGHVVKQGLDTYDDAVLYLRDHKRMLAN